MDQEFLLGLLRSGRDVGATLGSGLAAAPVAGYAGLAQLLRGKGLEAAADAVRGTQERMTYTPTDEASQRSLEMIGAPFQALEEKVMQPIAGGVADIAGPAAGTAVYTGMQMLDPTKGKTKAAKAVKPKGFAPTPETLATLDPAATIGRAEVRAMTPGREADVSRSLLSEMQATKAQEMPVGKLQTALANRERYRGEAPTLPKKATEMSPEEWAAYGQQHGVDMTTTPMQSLGISDLTNKREVMVPGGLEGKFTIPDLFQIKANNFDPNALPQDVHNQLMAKFLRTYERPGGHDPVDVFNDLNFALLSPNAPLTQNEFLAQRLRARTPEDLEAIAARPRTGAEGAAIDVESGVGAASRGGMGVKGTAMLENQTELARLLREKPEMFRPAEGETLRDVAWRVMNQVPGLSVKTASLGVPWTDLAKANTSAVDLHMIRNNYPRLMQENPRFAERMTQLREKNPSLSEEEAAIKIIGGGHPSKVYRSKKTGEVNPDVPASLAPEKLAREPEKYVMPNEFYTDIMGYVDEARGANPAHELFPEQWRLWDRYRGRVEPHEMAHPDWRKLPKMSFNEMQDALTEHKRLGYMGSADVEGDIPVPAKMEKGDWRALVYGLRGGKRTEREAQLARQYLNLLQMQEETQ